MEKLNDFTTLLDSCIKLYKQLQELFLTSLNDILMKKTLERLLKNDLIHDTIKIIKLKDYNIEDVINTLDDNSNNLFIKLANEYKLIINSNLIEKYTEQTKSQTKPQTKKPKANAKVKVKKSYEIEVLSNYIGDILETEKVNNIIEMGCGKSYLTDNILLNDNMVYIGIDKKDHLIEQTKKLNSSDNAVVINYELTVENFPNLYNSEISKYIKNEGIMLFGLHSCGNLTSDTIKLFALNDCFSHLVIIGCCLNLLTEFITPEAKQTELFKTYIENIGYDNKGVYLEETIRYEANDLIGYPLSQHIKANYPELFLARAARNAAMQNFPYSKEKLILNSQTDYHKKIFYRTLFQGFLEEHFEDIKKYYGYGKVDVNANETFSQYVRKMFGNFDKIFKTSENDVFRQAKQKFDSLNNIDEFAEEYFNRMKEYEDLVWAISVIKLKFAKLIEIIIALDRILYLKDNKVENIKLIKIFDEKKSVRNILIYAKK
jgi:hypothetical protein